MQNGKIAAAQRQYEKAVAQTQQCKAALAAGGSYALWRQAVTEEDAALHKLQELQAQHTA